jgi:hypothetical protein
MTFSTIPGMVPFGDLFSELAIQRPYDGPQMNAEIEMDGNVHRSAMGVALPDGAFWINDQNPLAIYAVAHDSWQRKICAFIFGILEEQGAHATLVIDRIDLPPRNIVIRSLRYVPPSRLQYSIFFTLDYRLRALRDYEGATIMIPSDAAAAVSKEIRLKSRQTGGAPEHAAKAWYAAQGFERRGRSIKQLQREMETATGSAPSETAIRAWERAAKD